MATFTALAKIFVQQKFSCIQYTQCLYTMKYNSIITIIAGARFWGTAKIIRALSEANYNQLLRQRDQPGLSHVAASTSANKPLTIPSD